MSTLLDRITISQPCSEDWQEMTGNNEVRFCSHCSKSVHNFSSITPAAAEQLILESGGRLCARYVKQKAIIMTAPPHPIQITRSASIAAAGVLATALTLSFAVPAQTLPSTEQGVVTIAQHTGTNRTPTHSDTVTVSGIVLDPNGAMIPGATVKLLNVATRWTATTTTDDEGLYEFRDVMAGDYELEIPYVAGFSKLIVRGLRIMENVSMTHTLELAPVVEVLVGVIALIDEPKVSTSDATPSVTEIAGRSLVHSNPRKSPNKKNKLPK